MRCILEVPGRAVWHVPGRPAVFLVADAEAGGILVNTPVFSGDLLAAIHAVAPLRVIFFPSAFGAVDAARWRAASGAKAVAYGDEGSRIPGGVDLALDRGWRVTREIDFLPMSGRTPGTCAMRVKRKPAIIFFGPALERQPSGWPGITAHPDDASFENRLIGAVALRHLKYDYALTDDYDPDRSMIGPGAARSIGAELDRVLAD